MAYINLFMHISSEKGVPEGAVAQIDIDVHKMLCDKIERLQKRDGRIRILDGQIIARNAEIKRLRKVLQQIADKNPFHNQCPPMNDLQYYAQVIVEMVTIANAELKESE